MFKEFITKDPSEAARVLIQEAVLTIPKLNGDLEVSEFVLWHI